MCERVYVRVSVPLSVVGPGPLVGEDYSLHPDAAAFVGGARIPTPSSSMDDRGMDDRPLSFARVM